MINIYIDLIEDKCVGKYIDYVQLYHNLVGILLTRCYISRIYLL